jgi:hypothetical protein
MWSSRSRLQLSTQRSATPFCQGLPNDVCTGLISKDRTAAGSSRPYFPSRSKIKNLGVDPNGNASRNCWMIQPLVGCFVTLTAQDVPPIMADDEEAVEHAEHDRWHREEIHGRNRFPMVSKEGPPALGRVRISRRSFHPTGDGSLGEFKTEHEEFPMYPRCSPCWVVSDHPKDQLPDLLRRRSSSSLRPNSGDQPPVDTKTSPVPADDSFGRNDEKGLLPSRPDPPSDYPEELIEEAQAWARMSAFQHGELLPEHEILQNKIPTATEEAN